MLEALFTAIPSSLAAMVITGVAVLMRVSLLVFLMPGVGELAIPVRVRLALTVLLTAALLPLAAPSPIVVDTVFDLAGLLIFESVIGFALGFSLRVLIHALTVAGTIIANAMSLSQIFGAGVLSEPNPSISMLLVVAGGALFVSLDLHTHAFGLVMESYMLFPLGEVPATDSLAEWAMARTAGSFALAVSLSLPFLLIGFLYSVVLGLMNQAMPQMMVTFVGIPANVFAGIFLLAISVGIILRVWGAQFDLAFEAFW